MTNRLPHGATSLLVDFSVILAPRTNPLLAFAQGCNNSNRNQHNPNNSESDDEAQSGFNGYAEACLGGSTLQFSAIEPITCRVIPVLYPEPLKREFMRKFCELTLDQVEMQMQVRKLAGNFFLLHFLKPFRSFYCLRQSLRLMSEKSESVFFSYLIL